MSSDAPPPAVTPVLQTVSGTVAAPAPTTVLVVDAPAVCHRVRTLLPADRFEVLGERDAAGALARAREYAPDVLIVAGEIASLAEDDLVRRLQTDASSHVRATFLLLPEGATYDQDFVQQTGADGVLVEPLEAGALIAEIDARTHVRRRPFEGLAALSDATAEQIAERVAEEIRRGVVDALKSGRSETIEVGDRSELTAVAWSAISQIRAHLAMQSDGRVQFHEDGLQQAPTLITVVDDASGVVPGTLDTRVLRGLCVLVADDDPSVVAAFAEVLREVGMDVLEARDGEQALDLAHIAAPHVVVSDIVMPKLDGFALCRAIKGDALLWHVPVILLSWKEDFLQRMRDLDAGASGYLRKEAGKAQILGAILDALAPRTRLLARLRSGGEVFGRVDVLGVRPLLEVVAQEHPNGSVSLRTAAQSFEVRFREGVRAETVCIGNDGTRTEGEAAFDGLLSQRAGTFSVPSPASRVTHAPAQPVAHVEPAVSTVPPTVPRTVPPPLPPPSLSATEPASKRRERVRLVFTLGLLFAVGYGVASQVERAAPPTAATVAAPVLEAASAVAHDPQPVPVQPPVTAPVPAAPAVVPAPAIADEPRLGKVLPYVDAARGVPVGEGQGLLVLEGGTGPVPAVQVGDRALGPLPIAIALPAGRHELVLRRGEDASFRYVVVRAGETRVFDVTAKHP